ncbi:MAG: ERCC4 domain-containing protein [Nitrososphaeria archaeon]
MLKIDSREAKGAKKVLEELEKMNIKYSIEKLEVGDYFIPSSQEDSPILIERKDIFDFAHSIRDQRIWAQAKKMSELHFKSAIVIEGSPTILEKTGRGWNISSIYGAINTIWLKYNIPILYTPTKHYTAILIANLCKRTSEHNIHTSIPKIVKTEDYKKVAIAMLSQIPLVNTVKAQKILQKFGTIKNVAENLDRLKEVEGVGEKVSDTIRKAFTTKIP